MRSVFCIIPLYIVYLVLVWACQNKSQQEVAHEYYESIEKLIAHGDYDRARLQIDTLLYFYTSDEKVIDKSMNYHNQLDSLVFIRKYNDLHKQMATLLEDLSTLQEKFIFEPSDIEDMPGRYTHKNQMLEKVFDQTFLKANVDENGAFYISSHYVGRHYIQYTQLRLSCGSSDVSTEVLGEEQGFHKRFNDGAGTCWEILVFTPDKDGGIPSFVAHNYKEELRLDFLGGKEGTHTILSEDDKEAIVESIKLGELIRSIKSLEKIFDLFHLENKNIQDSIPATTKLLGYE